MGRGDRGVTNSPSGPQRSGAPPEATPWQDLATNRPGQKVRAKAVELRAAHPALSVLARLLGVHTDERAFRVGAAGEAMVGRRLGRLGPTWRVLHSVPTGEASDIDHVVIGPGGVFTLDTKHHPGARVWVTGDTFIVGGRHLPYVRSARAEGRRASRLLGAACRAVVRVEPVLVVVAASLSVRGRPEGVHVVSRRRIAPWLASRPVVLDPDEVDFLFDRARRSTTWWRGGSPGG